MRSCANSWRPAIAYYPILKFIELALLGNFISGAYCLAETIMNALRVQRRSQKLSTEQRMSSGKGNRTILHRSVVIMLCFPL